jgi:hypothetical protein
MIVKQKTISFKRLVATALVAVTLVAQYIPINTANAAGFTGGYSELELEHGTGPGGGGGSAPGAIADHNFAFRVPTGADIGSIKLLYCTTAGPANIAAAFDSDCTMPLLMDTATDAPNATAIANQSEANVFTIAGGSPNGTIILTRTAANIAAGTDVSFTMTNITNPTPDLETTSGTFFVRIITYTGTDGATTPIDHGTVAASVTRQIVLTGAMPESLVFCAGANIDETDNVADCRTVTTGAISFNQLFSPSDTAYATSEMAASTNAGVGYVISVNGNTLENGSYDIAAMAAANHPIRGTEQFGLNLVHNTGVYNTVNYSDYAAANGGFGVAITDASNATNLKGQAAVGTYDTAEQFKFTTGDTVANSAYDGTTNTTYGPSDAQIYTVSYIANVTGSQPAGTYSTTLTYICTPTF